MAQPGVWCHLAVCGWIAYLLIDNSWFEEQTHSIFGWPWVNLTDRFLWECQFSFCCGFTAGGERLLCCKVQPKRSHSFVISFFSKILKNRSIKDFCSSGKWSGGGRTGCSVRFSFSPRTGKSCYGSSARNRKKRKAIRAFRGQKTAPGWGPAGLIWPRVGG